jgi:hypothetical protein
VSGQLTAGDFFQKPDAHAQNWTNGGRPSVSFPAISTASQVATERCYRVSRADGRRIGPAATATRYPLTHIFVEPMTDEPENRVLEMLRRLDAKVDRIATDVVTIKAEQRIHSRNIDIPLQEGRLLRAAVNDIAKENVTAGAIEAIPTTLHKCAAKSPR